MGEVCRWSGHLVAAQELVGTPRRWWRRRNQLERHVPGGDRRRPGSAREDPSLSCCQLVVWCLVWRVSSDFTPYEKLKVRHFVSRFNLFLHWYYPNCQFRSNTCTWNTFFCGGFRDVFRCLLLPSRRKPQSISCFIRTVRAIACRTSIAHPFSGEGVDV